MTAFFKAVGRLTWIVNVANFVLSELIIWLAPLGKSQIGSHVIWLGVQRCLQTPKWFVGVTVFENHWKSLIQHCERSYVHILSGQKLIKDAKMYHFWHFLLTFAHSKCKRSSQCWMRLFLWFSNTVKQGQIHFRNCIRTLIQNTYSSTKSNATVVKNEPKMSHLSHCALQKIKVAVAKEEL